MLKRLVYALAVISIILTLVGCGEIKPSKITENFLSAIKGSNVETIREIYTGDYQVSLITLEGDKMSKEVTDILTKKVLEFDYSVIGETIIDNQAIVEVQIDTYNFGTIMKQAFSEYLTQALAFAFSESGDKNTDILNPIVLNKLEKLQKNYSEKVKVNLIKVDDMWNVEALKTENKELRNALTGNMLTASEEFSKSISK